MYFHSFSLGFRIFQGHVTKEDTIKFTKPCKMDNDHFQDIFVPNYLSTVMYAWKITNPTPTVYSFKPDISKK